MCKTFVFVLKFSNQTLRKQVQDEAGFRRVSSPHHKMTTEYNKLKLQEYNWSTAFTLMNFT